MEEKAPYVTDMMCPKCGHPADHHGYEGCMYPHKPDDIGDDYECLCNKTQEEIERDAWKAEAMAARKLLDEYKRNTTIINHTADFERAQDAYLAARVKDTP